MGADARVEFGFGLAALGDVADDELHEVLFPVTDHDVLGGVREEFAWPGRFCCRPGGAIGTSCSCCAAGTPASGEWFAGSVIVVISFSNGHARRQGK